VRHHVVHQVLANRLRPLVKEISLLLADLFKAGGFLSLADASRLGFFSLATATFLCLLLVPKVILLLASDKGSNLIFTFRVLGLLLLSQLSALLRSQIVVFTLG
jgi:hypothetical protein